jgi:cytochrome c oxidase subunit II
MKFFKPALVVAGLFFASTVAIAEAPGKIVDSPAAAAPSTSAPSAVTPGPAVAITTPVAGSEVKAGSEEKKTQLPAAPTPLVPVEGIGMPVDGMIGIQPQVTELGQRAQWMHDALLMPLITIITLFVLGLLLWVMARYRRKANPVASKTSHNTFIEIVWTLLPVLILIGVSIPSISLLAAQFKPAGKDAVVVKVTGHQWYWSYEYPDHGDFSFDSYMLKDKGGRDPLSDKERARTDADGPHLLAADNRLVVPVDTEIKVIVTSDDVIHAFAVPAFWTKMDAVPGRLNELTFKVMAGKEGVYFGQCSELCGARHGFMPIAVEVVTKANFAKWIASKGGTMPGAAKVAAPAPVAAAAALPPLAAPAPAPAAPSK